jgi:outer membrane protein assembly factor BamB
MIERAGEGLLLRRRYAMTCGRIVALGAAAVLALAAGAVAAEPNWPQWQGPAQDNKSPDTGLLKQWPAGGPKLLWTGKGIGQPGYSTVSVADGLVYTTGPKGGVSTITAFDMNGQQKWQVPNGPEFKGDNPGSRATPTIDGGLLYVLSGVGRLGCFDGKTGAEKWAKQITTDFGGRVPRWGYAESVLIEGDKVIVTPGGKNAVVALNKTTGATVWKADFNDGASYCTPVAFDFGGIRQICTFTVKFILGLEAGTGKVLWSHPYTTDWDVHATTPVFSNGAIYGTSGYKSSGFRLDLKVEDGKVQVTQKWTDPLLGNHHGGVVMVDGVVYGYGERGGWVALDFATGKAKYTSKPPGKGSLTYADGMLYCLTESGGTMALVKPAADKFEIVSQFKVPSGGSGPYWAHPVVVGGRLYVRHADNLYVYDVK